MNEIAEAAYPPLLLMVYWLNQSNGFEFDHYHKQYYSILSLANKTGSFEQRVKDCCQQMHDLHAQLQAKHPPQDPQDFAAFEQRAAQSLGGQSQLLVRGHDLMDHVILPLSKHICSDRKRQQFDKIQNRASTDKANKIKQYQHTVIAIDELIKNRVDFDKTLVYPRLVEDLSGFFNEFH